MISPTISPVLERLVFEDQIGSFAAVILDGVGIATPLIHKTVFTMPPPTY